MTDKNYHTKFNHLMNSEILDFAFPKAKASELKVIGVGGGGSNAVSHMYNTGQEDVQLIICNTDSQALENSPVSHKIQLGKTLTGGRGAGSDPAIGREAAIESMDEILEMVRENTDMVFITAGMGGGTGTGAAPIIAKKIKELGILTVAIVTVPFNTEIGNRVKFAEKGIEEISKSVDSLIVIENEKLNVNFSEFPLSEAFRKADEVLSDAVRSIVEIIKIHGQWNVDFNDVKTVMHDSNVALMGEGRASGEERASKAVVEALNYPLLNNNDISGAKNILINIVSGENEVLVKEHHLICEHVQKITGREAEQFIIGTARNLDLKDEIKVTIIATGFNAKLVFDFWDQPKEEEETKIEEEQKIIVESQINTDELQEEETEVKVEEEVIDEEEMTIKKPKQSGIQRLINFFDDEIE